MQFNSAFFPFFMAWVLLARFWVRTPQLWWGILGAASILFYSFQGLLPAAYLVGSTVLNFYLIRFFQAHNASWGLFGLGLGLNLLPLMAVKLGLLPHIPGISFIVFHSLSYVIDAGQGILPRIVSFRQFFASLTFFPPLVAGPILRGRQFLPELESVRPLTWSDILPGAALFIEGLFLKSVVADHLAGPVQAAFGSNWHVPHAGYWWLMALMLTLRVYCDFAGYSRMARGLAHMLGLEVPWNFRAPFVATSLTDFWRRWHIGLTEWMRDYVFTPLRYQWRRRPHIGLAASILITFALSGLWHGLEGHYLAWGLFHGILLTLEHFIPWKKFFGSGPAPTFLAWAATILFVILSMVLFGARDLQQAQAVFKTMFTGESGPLPFHLSSIPLFTMLLFFPFQ